MFLGSTIFNKSCESMDEIPDNAVSLTITSPPYWNAIDYDSHASDSQSDYRIRREVDYRSEYLPFLAGCFKEVLRVHKDNTFCAVVIGTVLFNGEHTPLPYDFTVLMEQIGWKFHQDITWYKCTGGVKRAGNSIRNPYPGYYYPNLMTEDILIFRKPAQNDDQGKIYMGRSEEEKKLNEFETDAVFKYDIANNIWHIAPVPPRMIDHPCPFPEEIPYRLIRLYSYRNDIVLDPFMGTGTTLKVANSLHRKWIGYETSKVYIDMAYQRISEPLVLRTQLLCRFDKIEYGEDVKGKNKPRAPFRSGKLSRRDAETQKNPRRKPRIDD